MPTGVHIEFCVEAESSASVQKGVPPKNKSLNRNGKKRAFEARIPKKTGRGRLPDKVARALSAEESSSNLTGRSPDLALNLKLRDFSMNTTFSRWNAQWHFVFMTSKLYSGGDRAGFAPASLFSHCPGTTIDNGHLKAIAKSLSWIEFAPYHASYKRVNATKN